MTAPAREPLHGGRLARLAATMGDGMRTMAIRFVGPLLLFALVLVAIHWIAEQFDLKLTGQQMVHSLWILLLAAGVAMTLRRRG